MKEITEIKKLQSEMENYAEEKEKIEQERNKLIRELNNKINRKKRAMDKRADRITEIWAEVTQNQEASINIDGIKEKNRRWETVIENPNQVANSLKKRGLKNLYKTETIRTPKKTPIKKMILEGSRLLAGIRWLKLVKKRELVMSLKTGEKISRTLSTFQKAPPSR